MKMGPGVEIAHEPGDTYEEHPGDTAHDARERANQRQSAIKNFQEVAGQEVRGKIHELANGLVSLSIQLRALNQSASGTGIGAKLREIADFMEDL